VTIAGLSAVISRQRSVSMDVVSSLHDRRRRPWTDASVALYRRSIRAPQISWQRRSGSSGRLYRRSLRVHRPHEDGQRQCSCARPALLAL